MDETPRQRLARLVAGIPADTSPMPNFAVGTAPNSTPMPNFATRGTVPSSAMPNFAPPGGSSAYLPPMRLPQPTPPAADPYAFLPPYAGLKNEKNPPLPPFEQPGSSLPMDRYMEPRPAPQAMPAPAMQPAMPVQTGGQGWGGPEPAPGTMPELQGQQPVELDPRYLPEQWRGRFNNGWG